MHKSIDEIASEILIAALQAGQVKTTAQGTTGQGDEIGSAFKRIREAVASALPPGP